MHALSQNDDFLAMKHPAARVGDADTTTARTPLTTRDKRSHTIRILSGRETESKSGPAHTLGP